MGFLDMFDSPDIMGSLLGINSAQAAPGPPPPQAMPPTAGPPPQAMPPPGMPPAGPPQMMPGKGDMAPMGPTFDQRFSAPPQDPAVLAALTAPGAPGGVPLRPGDQYGGVSPGDPGARGAGGGGSPPPMPPPGGMPPPMPPASMMANGGPPTMSQGGGLSRALGLNPQAAQQAMAGIGKGLTAVGHQKPGTFAGTAFAGGAGGGLEGAVHQQDVQTQQKRQADNDLFNQKSTAFKDWIAGKNLGNTEMISQARAKYYESLAQMKASGGTGSNAWQNTPYGKAANLETMLDRWEGNQRLQLQAKWKATGSSPEEIKADLADMAKKKEAERDRRSKALGISPTEYKKGTGKEDAFDMEKLTPQQRAIMPDGAWYRYKAPGDPKADADGYVYRQRDWLATPPHPGWQPQAPQPQGGQQQQPSPYQVEANDAATMGET